MDWDEIFQWQLKPLPKYEASCSKCDKKIVHEDGLEQSILALKNAGWQLRDDGPCCADCQSGGLDAI